MAASGDHLPARGSSQRATIGTSIDGVEIDCKVKLNQIINANDLNFSFLTMQSSVGSSQGSPKEDGHPPLMECKVSLK